MAIIFPVKHKGRKYHVTADCTIHEKEFVTSTDRGPWHESANEASDIEILEIVDYDTLETISSSSIDISFRQQIEDRLQDAI